jgi:hypothetical protein
MKATLVLMLAFMTSTAFGRILKVQDKLFLRAQGKQVPIFAVNEMIQKKAVSKVKIFNEGRAPIIAFARKNEKEKLYSVDEKGFIYSIEPFTNYEVSDVGDDGSIKFREFPDRKYKVNSQGFFIH